MAKNKIYIDPSKRGTFTSAANKRNKTVKQFTDMVLSNKDNYSSEMVRKAVFARNASKWNKKREGGDIVSTMGYRDDSPFRNSESLNIYSPEGFIDMSNVGIPIMANGQRLEPYSGLNQVPPSSSGYVKETPLIAKYGGSWKTKMDNGGSILRISPKEIKKRNELRSNLNQPVYYNNRRINPWGFISSEELDIVAGGGINFPSGTGVNALGIIPRDRNSDFKGMGILGVSQQLGPNWNIGAEVSSPFLRDWETGKLQTNIQPSLRARYNIPYTQNKPKRKSLKYLKYGGNIPTYYQDSGTPIYRDTTDAPPTVYQKGGNIQDIPEVTVYSDKKKNKKLANLLDKAKGLANTVAGRIVDKQNRYEDFSLKSVGQYIKDVKAYQKGATEYEKARRLVKEGKMSTESFVNRYNDPKNNWAQYDPAVRKNTPEEQAELEQTWYGGYNPVDIANQVPYWLAAGATGPFAIGAATPVVSAALANPVVQAGLTAYGGYDATTNTIPATYDALKEGDYWEAAGNTALTGLNLAPIPVFGKNLLNRVKNIPTGKLNVPKSFKSEINWGKWNKDIPKNKPLMDEYRSIEHRTKKAGTWMKNPDGSKFTGTPEQFVQQQSQNFKKAFPNPVVDDAGNIQISYHGSGSKFNEFDPSKFYSGDFGKGVYTSPLKEKIMRTYANPSKRRTQSRALKNDGDEATTNLYELYINSKNPGNYDNIIDNRINYIGDIRNYGKTADDFPTLAEWKNTNKEFLEQNAFLKTDQNILDFLNNQSLYNKGFNVRENFESVLPEYDFLSIPSTPFKEQVTPFSNRLKSAIGNSGMFDMTNPNIYKSLLPIGGAAGIMGATVNDEVNTKQKGGNIYNVKSGDTFYGIANRHNMSKQNLIDANPGININALKLNQPINIPLRPADGLEYQVYNNKGKSYRPDHFYRKAGNYWQIKGPNTGGKYVTITDPTRLSNIDRDARVFEDPRYMMPKELPQAFIDHINLREGEKKYKTGPDKGKHYSYRDTEEVLTGGRGHELTEEEALEYPEWKVIPQWKVDEWFKYDTERTYKAALKQAKELGVYNPEFINALAAVNYQLGPAWNTKHKNTWKYLMDKDYENAAEEAARSIWYTQTPVRVKDFQKGIRTLINSKKYGGTITSKGNIYQDGGPTNNNYANIEGVNPAKLQQWYSLGKEAPTSIKEAILLAEAIGYPPSQAIAVGAQWALESGHGRSIVATKQNNFFGIKSHSEAVRKRLADKYGINVSAGPNLNTIEHKGGKKVNQKSSFMTFDDSVAGFLAHKAFLETNSRYKDALTKMDPYEFIKELKDADYATDVDYIKKMGNIMRPFIDQNTYNRFSTVSSNKVAPKKIRGFDNLQSWDKQQQDLWRGISNFTPNAKDERTPRGVEILKRYNEAIGTNYVPTDAWSAVFISNAVMNGLGAQNLAELRELGFNPSKAHASFIRDAFKTNKNPKYIYNKYIAKPLGESSYEIGDILAQGRKRYRNGRYVGPGTSKWTYKDFEKQTDNYISHTDIIVDKGTDDVGEYIILAGGNLDDTYKRNKIYTNKLKNRYKVHLTHNKDRVPSSTSKSKRLNSSHAKVLNRLPNKQKSIITELNKDQRFNVLDNLSNIENYTISDIDNQINNVMMQNVKLDKKNPYIDKLDVSMTPPKRRPQFGQGELFRRYGGIIKKY